MTKSHSFYSMSIIKAIIKRDLLISVGDINVVRADLMILYVKQSIEELSKLLLKRIFGATLSAIKQ